MKSTSLDKHLNASSNANKRSHSYRSQIALKILKTFKKSAKEKLSEKYHTDESCVNKKIVNDIIYNEKAHVVAQFKDHLIFDDTNEFLRRFYRVNECFKKLPSIYEFYESFSKIFANYIILPESKYMYKNIQRKQKMIDNLQKFQSDRDNNNIENDKIFNTEIYNSIMNQTTQYEDINMGQQQQHILKNISSQLITISPTKKDDSICSLETLIYSIGKAEKNIKNPLDENFNSINSNISESLRRSNLGDSKIIRESLPIHSVHLNQGYFNGNSLVNPLTKIHSPSPSMNLNSNILINTCNININNFNKAKQVEQNSNCSDSKFQAKIKIEEKNRKNSIGSKIKSKITPSPNLAENFEKIILSDRGDNSDRIKNSNKFFNINSNAGNVLASTLSGNNKIKSTQGSTLHPKTKLISQNKAILVNSNPNQTEYYKVSKLGQNHKSTNSMPKLPTKEIDNNIIGNYQSTLATSVDKNLLMGSMNLPKFSKDENSPSKAPNSSRVSTLGGLVNSLNNMITNINNVSSKDSKLKLQENATNKQPSVITSNNYNKDYIKFVSSYTSDISKIKKKVSNLVSDSQNSKLTKKNSQWNINTSGNASKYTSVLNSNANTISVSNPGTTNAHNLSNSKIKNSMNKRELQSNSLTSRELESMREKNSIRALLHRDLFVNGEPKDKIVKKTNVANTKVDARPQSKIRENILSRNSIDKLLLENSKEKLVINNSNLKNISHTNNNEKKNSLNPVINNNVSSPKSSVNKYNISNKVGTVTKLNNNFLMQSNQNIKSANFNLNEYKNIRRNTKNCSAAIKSISNLPGNLSNHSNQGVSNTPNKQISNCLKNVPGILILGENTSNVSNVQNSQCNGKVFHKVVETARKLHDSKVVVEKTSNNTPNNASKQIMKIKNFFEVVKNGTISSNSNSARLNSKKPDAALNPYKIKTSMVK